MDFVLLLLVILLRQEVAALKLLHVNVPANVFKDTNALLECRYDAEKDGIYGITWYKDHEVFYKYEFNTAGKYMYTVDGIKVDSVQSDHQQVVLKSVTLRTTGMYKCEVSGEGPSFSSVSGNASMEVIVLPNETPKITGEEKVYASGDVLALNCTSDKSHPAARLKWFVNGQQVKPDSEMFFEQHGLYSTISSLLLELNPSHLVSDKIIVRCEATVRPNYVIDDRFIDTRDTKVFDVRDQIIINHDDRSGNEKSAETRFNYTSTCITYR
nr:PREDICTED: LOW QUALITY PROTEIN: uncharacterized protein LOC105674723 [Linepithema humile]